MIAGLLVVGMLVAPGKKAHKTDGVLERVEMWADTALSDGARGNERRHLSEKGAGRIHRGAQPTFYKSPFNKRRETA